MKRASEHAAFASNLALDATNDLARGEHAAAYKKLLQARTEIEVAVAHVQIHAPAAVFEANRVSWPATHVHLSRRAEDEVVSAFSGVESPAPDNAAACTHVAPSVQRFTWSHAQRRLLLVTGGAVS